MSLRPSPRRLWHWQWARCGGHWHDESCCWAGPSENMFGYTWFHVSVSYRFMLIKHDQPLVSGELGLGEPSKLTSKYLLWNTIVFAFCWLSLYRVLHLFGYSTRLSYKPARRRRKQIYLITVNLLHFHLISPYAICIFSECVCVCPCVQCTCVREARSIQSAVRSFAVSAKERKGGNELWKCRTGFFP